MYVSFQNGPGMEEQTYTVDWDKINFTKLQKKYHYKMHTVEK